MTKMYPAHRIDPITKLWLLTSLVLIQLQSGTCSGSNGAANHSLHSAAPSDSPGNHAATTTTSAPITTRLITNETAARIFLEDLNSQATAACQTRANKDWNYATNITSYNKQQATESSVAFSKFWKEMWGKLNRYNWTGFEDPQVKRQFLLLSVMGISILPEAQLRRYQMSKQALVSTYSTAKVCDLHNKTRCNLNLEPELTETMMHSRDPELLKHIWVQWRNQTGRKMRKNFTEMVSLFSQAALLNKYPDASEYELRSYESPNFKEDIEKLWLRLKPFYTQLHAYVRAKLRGYYGSEIISRKGSIPAHLLGNMWAQSWVNVMDIVRPFNKSSLDVTDNMIRNELKPVDMAKIAEEFFVSIGLSPMPPEFWSGSILEKPKDRDIICHASAWDMCNGRDFWIKQCTRVNMEDLITLHHEMGHTQYQMQYKNQPKTFRDGANPGFHEAIGDLMALSVQTPHHLKEIGLLEHAEEDNEAEINYLLSMALEKIAFLPFAYLMDLWRWNVYTNKTTAQTYNCDWWELRESYQGIFPPQVRTEEDFDAGAKFHITTNSPYIQYFVSAIVQFQFHEALCKAAGQFNPENKEGKPLHHCDIYRSHAAGEKLSKMLQLGSSRPWPDALEIVTGKRTLDADSILNYFQPLIKWLKQENSKTNEYIGWVVDKSKPPCVPPSSGRNGGNVMSSSSTFEAVVGSMLVIISLFF